MPTEAKATVSVNGAAKVSGGITVPSAASVAFTGLSTTGWQSQKWELYDFPPGYTAPAGWSTDANGVIFSTDVAPSAITLPANTTTWGKWMLRLTVTPVGQPGVTLIDEMTALSMLSPKGQRDVAFGETIQFGGPRAWWAAELKATLRAIEGQLGGESTQPSGVSIVSQGAQPGGSVDAAPAIRLAMAVARLAGHYRVALPAGTFRIGSNIRVYEPFIFSGAGRELTKLVCDPGIEAAFSFFTGAAAPGGIGAKGAQISQLEITCTPTQAVVAYAPSTAYTLGQFIKPTLYNKHVYKVIKAGTSAAVNEATALVNEPHTPSRAVVWSSGLSVSYGQLVRPTNTAQWGYFFMCTTPAAGAAPKTTTTEPTWNYTVNGTTTDAAGITWTCLADPNILMIGTAICEVAIFSGLFIMCPMTVRNVRVKNAQTAAVFVEGNGSSPILDSDGRDVFIDDLEIILPGGNRGLGLYLRGGELTGGYYRSVRVIGTAGSGQGSVALPTDGSQNEHGIWDESFTGNNTFVACDVKNCRGYDYAAVGNSTRSVFLGCLSDFGRLMVPVASQWVGPTTGTFWGASNTIGYASLATSISSQGLHNGYESRGGVIAGLNDGTVAQWLTDPSDSGYSGFRYAGGWWTHGWAASNRAAFAFNNAQVQNSANLPNGEDAGVLVLPRGFGIGPTSDYRYEFASLSDFQGVLRGGYRRVGDVCHRPDRVAAGAYESDIVVTAGYAGVAWTSSTAKNARITSGGTAKPAAIVVPTSGGNLNAFQCTVGGTTGATEPTWPGTLNATVVDGTVTWKNVGPQPVVAPFGYIGTLPTGNTSVDPATLPMTGFWEASYTGSPWTGKTSTGASGGRTLTEATNPPATGAAVNGLTPPDFNGTSQVLGAAAAGANYIGNYISATAYSYTVLFYADTATADTGGDAYLQPCIIGDMDFGGDFGLAFSSVGVRAWHKDSGGGYGGVTLACSTGAWHAVQVVYDGTNLKVRLDGGSWSTLAKSNVASAPLTAIRLRLGANYSAGKFFDGRVPHFSISNTAISDANLLGVLYYLKNKFGVNVAP